MKISIGNMQSKHKIYGIKLNAAWVEQSSSFQYIVLFGALFFLDLVIKQQMYSYIKFSEMKKREHKVSTKWVQGIYVNNKPFSTHIIYANAFLSLFIQHINTHFAEFTLVHLSF